jgi:FkbM family methyltransferase
MALGRYERLIQTVICSNVARGEHAYDIGANVGFFSLLLASLVGPCGKVHAFEPSPPEADAIDALVGCNDLAKIVHIHRMAVSDETGHSTFLSSGLTGMLANAPQSKGKHVGVMTQSVPTTTLDDFVFALDTHHRTSSKSMLSRLRPWYWLARRGSWQSIAQRCSSSCTGDAQRSTHFPAYSMRDTTASMFSRQETSLFVQATTWMRYFARPWAQRTF